MSLWRVRLDWETELNYYECFHIDLAHFTELMSYSDKVPCFGPYAFSEPCSGSPSAVPLSKVWEVHCTMVTCPSEYHLHNFLDHNPGIRMLKFSASSPFSRFVQASSPGLSLWGLITQLLFMRQPEVRPSEQGADSAWTFRLMYINVYEGEWERKRR